MNMMAARGTLALPVLFIAILTTFATARDTTKQESDEVAKAAPAASVANKGENPWTKAC
jgi:hypothetical protein